MLSVPTVYDYFVLGVPVIPPVITVFNGVVYGIIAWLAKTVLNRTGTVKLSKTKQLYLEPVRLVLFQVHNLARTRLVIHYNTPVFNNFVNKINAKMETQKIVIRHI